MQIKPNVESSCPFFSLFISSEINFSSKEAIRQKEIAGMEAQIYRLVDLLSEQRSATLENVRRKQAKAGEDNEDDEDVGGGDISDDESDPEDDGLIYNPKNLPLGWDGKVRQ
jgi:splicing factor 3A subunit 3